MTQFAGRGDGLGIFQPGGSVRQDRVLVMLGCADDRV